MALGTRIVDEGEGEEGHADHPALIEEIRTKMLPRRGITARADEILITLGGQNAHYLLARLLANMGAAGSTPVPERFGSPVDMSKDEKRWLQGLYLDVPEEWDDPYRFFRW